MTKGDRERMEEREREHSKKKRRKTKIISRGSRTDDVPSQDDATMYAFRTET